MMTKITLLYPAKTYGFDHLVLSLPIVELGEVHFQTLFFHFRGGQISNKNSGHFTQISLK